jgi:endonuclease/exonuclease/phosphatase family metal-dependent hydrolase
VQVEEGTVPAIRIMTFNVQGCTHPSEGPHSWGSRAALNVRTIRRYAPDLIGFQEVQRGNLATYGAELAGYDHVAGNRYGDVAPTEHTSIFWKRARFALVESGEFWFSRTPDRPSADWGVPYPMGATWARLRCVEDGAHLLHLNTHFEDGPGGALSRAEASKLLVARAAQLQGGAPAVLTGDFNCNPWHEPYRTFLSHGFTDTYRAAGHGDSAASSTLHGFRGAGYFALEWGGELYWRVDWVLTRDGAARLQATSCTIARDAEPPVYPSDHYPVVAEVLLLA